MTNNQNTPMWTPSQQRIETSNLVKFMTDLNSASGLRMESYADMQDFALSDVENFWTKAWDFFGVVGDKGDIVLENGDKMPGAQFFPQARLNFAENLLKFCGDDVALIFRGEDKVATSWTGNELKALVSRLQQALMAAGVQKGDRVAAIMPNMPHTIAYMLAASSLGAVWSSCSPDFGVRGILDRFEQIDPKILITVDGYYYNGKEIDISDKVVEVSAQLGSLKKLIITPYLNLQSCASLDMETAKSLSDFIEGFEEKELHFEKLPFAHPLYILFSSGTTGMPKCIVHSAGGTLLQHLKEHVLQTDVKPGDKLFYFTTCGWMMWNWLVSGLAAGATLVLFDGSPFYPNGNVLFDLVDEVGIDHFGTSAKFIDSVKKAELSPMNTHDLGTMKTLMSTGSPLVPESFDFIYSDIKSDLALASISGGTDIVACFVGGNPLSPVWRGEIMGPMLAMAVEVWDDAGKAVSGEKGELVCTRPFPSMPIGFWNDDDGQKYYNAYFARYENVWCHGDFAEITQHGGMIIHGRSDATLNPGGVRIGTAEIYAQVEQFPEIIEAIAIGQQYDGDVRVVLFVVVKEGVNLDEDLINRIKKKIRTGASPRHVPAVIAAVKDIPRTKSGKITEIAVRDVVHGRQVKNTEALANPEALDHFINRAELEI